MWQRYYLGFNLFPVPSVAKWAAKIFNLSSFIFAFIKSSLFVKITLNFLDVVVGGISYSLSTSVSKNLSLIKSLYFVKSALFFIRSDNLSLLSLMSFNGDGITGVGGAGGADANGGAGGGVGGTGVDDGGTVAAAGNANKSSLFL